MSIISIEIMKTIDDKEMQKMKAKWFCCAF